MAYFRKEDLTEVPIYTVVSTVTDDPLVLYNTWATELGLSTTATDYNLDGDDNAWLINVNGNFLKGKQTTETTNTTFSSEGGLGFHLNPIPATSAAVIVRLTTLLPGVNKLYTLSDRPDLLYTFHPTSADCATSGVKLQKTATTTIISGIIHQWDYAPLYNSFAIRLEDNKVTMVYSAVELDVTHRFFGYLFNTTGTNLYTNSLELEQVIGTTRKLVFTIPNKQYSFSGNINESSGIDTWRVTLTKCSTGENTVTSGVIDTVIITGIDYSMVSDSPDSCNITIAPKIDYQWSTNKVAVVGDFVIPSNPDTIPHLFKVTTEGTFGASEASWNLTGTTTQGTAILTYVAALLNPVTIGPKLGTPVSI
jgi:hypothetical protein